MSCKYFVIKNPSQIITVSGNKAKKGSDMQDIGVVTGKSILIEGDTIVTIDTMDALENNFDLSDSYILDASGKTITPGFVDSHTHFVFGGYREEEYSWRLRGDSYVDIMNNGGGIVNSVKGTKETSLDHLIEVGYKRLDSMLSFGVTTVEGKSGYGLDLDTELKQLRAYKKLNEIHDLDIVTTFLGPHAVLPEYKGKESDFIQYMNEQVLPKVKEENLAEFADIFTEKGVFGIEDSRTYLQKAKDLGFKLKMHADEIVPLGGAELAAEMGAISADHLLQISDQGIKDMAAKDVVATLLPLTAFSLKEEYARARDMIDGGLAVALATDMNPGSCFSESVPLMIALATLYMNMTTEEVITALTINAAAAIDRAEEIGSIDPGKKADLLIHEFDSYKFIPYHFGISTVDKVIKNGKLIYEKERV